MSGFLASTDALRSSAFRKLLSSPWLLAAQPILKLIVLPAGTVTLGSSGAVGGVTLGP